MSVPLSDLGPPLLTSWPHDLGCAEAEFYRELGSTNDHARQRIADRIATPALIVAERQTSGRGRGNHRWAADIGALTFSLILDPDCRCGQGWVSLATAIGVGEAIASHTAIRPQWKWPNDVWCHARKVAGILLETTASRLIVGVGLNVNNRIPTPLSDSAVSLHELTGHPLGLAELLQAIVRQITTRLATDASQLHPLWARHCALRDRRITVTQADETWTGRCGGVLPSGRLSLRPEDGDALEFASGTVRVTD